MKHGKQNGRRAFLGALAKGLTAFAGGSFLLGGSAPASAGVFAGRFLRDKKPLQLPPGYYDEGSQLYHDAATGEPMFVEGGIEAGVPLSEEQLAELLQSHRFVDLRGLPRIKVAQSTSCTLSTLSTTSCCPIVTDSSPDSVEDD